MSKERPILFSAPMVNAILAGDKTQTRRIVKPQPDIVANLGTLVARYTPDDERLGRLGQVIPCPYGQPGDWLWVRENFSGPHYQSRYSPKEWNDCDPIWYWADGNPESGDWTTTKPSIHMPRWASRISLEIVSVRVERLQDTSEEDALAEEISCENLIVSSYYANGHHEVTADRYFFDGCAEEGFESACDAYAALWEKINGAGSWGANPFVWVVSFKRVAQ